MQLETTVVTPTPQTQTHTHTHTHTDKSNSLLKSLQQHRAQRFPLPFPRPPKCFSVLHGPPHKHTHTGRQTVPTFRQRTCKSAFIGPLAAHTHEHTDIHTLGVAASRNLGGGTDWQGRSEEVAEFRLWIITSVSPIVPGLRAVNTRS